MIRISISYFYGLGAALSKISSIKAEMPLIDVWYNLYSAHSELSSLFSADWFLPAVRSAYTPGQRLLQAAKAITDRTDYTDGKINQYEAFEIASALSEFDTVLKNELATADTYFVTRKAAYDTGTLISNPERIFPDDLVAKVPQALRDIREAGKCLAFELSTAAGFHVLRATESVIRCYWTAVSGGKPHPKQKNLGVYLDKMEKSSFGSSKVRAALKQIKDLHRNPLMHPEETLALQDAVGLFGICQSAISGMLKEIPTPKPAPTQPASA